MLILRALFLRLRFFRRLCRCRFLRFLFSILRIVAHWLSPLIAVLGFLPLMQYIIIRGLGEATRSFGFQTPSFRFQTQLRSFALSSRRRGLRQGTSHKTPCKKEGLRKANATHWHNDQMRVSVTVAFPHCCAYRHPNAVGVNSTR